MPKAGFPGDSWWGSAMRVSEQGKVGQRSVPEAKRSNEGTVGRI